jgi:O-acetyl-ADP-ribose deacetylase (regulator of RNase III)
MVRGGGVSDFQVAAVLDERCSSGDNVFVRGGLCGFWRLLFRFRPVASSNHANVELKKMSETELHVGKERVRLVQGDITSMETDAIVNAANSSLMGGGGVDGAIHRRGGPVILEECKRIRATDWTQGLPTGKAVITGGGNLKAKRVIHTVGPIWRGGNRGEPMLLADAYQNSLRLAVANGLKSVAFPSISTGAYGYPVEDAALVALKTVKEFLEKEDSLGEVVFVLFSERALEVYRDKAKEVFGKL